MSYLIEDWVEVVVPGVITRDFIVVELFQQQLLITLGNALQRKLHGFLL